MQASLPCCLFAVCLRQSVCQLPPCFPFFFAFKQMHGQNTFASLLDPLTNSPPLPARKHSLCRQRPGRYLSQNLQEPGRWRGRFCQSLPKQRRHNYHHRFPHEHRLKWNCLYSDRCSHDSFSRISWRNHFGQVQGQQALRSRGGSCGLLRDVHLYMILLTFFCVPQYHTGSHACSLRPLFESLCTCCFIGILFFPLNLCMIWLLHLQILQDHVIYGEEVTGTGESKNYTS